MGTLIILKCIPIFSKLVSWDSTVCQIKNIKPFGCFEWGRLVSSNLEPLIPPGKSVWLQASD